MNDLIDKIEVVSEDVSELSGVSKKTQQPYSMRIQTMYVHFPNSPHPDRVEVTLKDGQEPYKAGFYKPKKGFLAVFNNGLVVRMHEIEPTSVTKKQVA